MFKEAWSYAWSLYRLRFGSVLLLGLTIAFPIQLLHMLFSGYFYMYFGFVDALWLGDLFNMFLILVFMPLAQVPFIQMALTEYRGEVTHLGDAYRASLKYMFSVYLFGLIYALSVTFGTLLLLVPGLVLMVLFFAYPYVLVITGRKGWSIWKETYVFAKKHFFKLIAAIVIFGVVEWLIGTLLLFGSLQFTQRYILINFTQMGVNLLVLPLFVFVVAYYCMDWFGVNDESFYEFHKA